MGMMSALCEPGRMDEAIEAYHKEDDIPEKIINGIMDWVEEEMGRIPVPLDNPWKSTFFNGYEWWSAPWAEFPFTTA